MSSLVNPTNPAAISPLPGGGFDIQGIEDQVNRLEGSDNADNIVGGRLDDILSGLGGNNTISGGAGDDGISGGAGDDVLSGGDGNDVLNGGTGNNFITGDAGNDRLIVESGGSTLTGGTDNDIFQLDFRQLTANTEETPSIDDLGITITEITDFQPGEDQITIQGLGGIEAPVYNRDTGILSLDDVEIAQLSENLNISTENIEILDNSNPLSTVSNSQTTVTRFLNPSVGVHFYTADETERAFVEENLSIYSSEGPSYRTADPTTGAQEVYRFFNPSSGVHLYTTDKVERDFLIENTSGFNFEGVKFYAYENQVEGSIPIYRFFEPSLGVHFYTPNEIEKDFVQANLNNYNFEGIAYYALPVEGS